MSIVLEQLTKRYGNQPVVDKVSLEVADGELFVLLGASGSGKSTILRLIAGLSQPDSGRILLHGRDVTLLAPQQRGSGFVFQNYSIFRHMSVAENIEFGLKIRRLSPAERARRREELLDLVGLAGLGSRHSDQLSGGQQQRVALARALAYQPNVLLLDEPFGALDVKIRTQLRRSLKKIQRQLNVTAILVTHDQEEAFELADRIGVMEGGRLLEVGGAEALYARPKSLFVATFLGAGTVLVGHAENGEAHFGPLRLPIPEEVPHEDGAPVQVLIRPEQAALSTEPPRADAPLVGRGTVLEQNFAAATRRVRLRMPRLPATRQIMPVLPFGEEGLLVDAVLPAGEPLSGREFWVSLRGWHILEQPPRRLLVCDAGKGPTTALAIARQLLERLGASATVLAVAADSDATEELAAALKQRLQVEGLSRSELRVRYGDPAEQIAAEQAGSLYDLLVLTAPPKVRATPLKVFPALDRRLRRLSATVLEVLEHTHIPVLVVNEGRNKIERILICTAAGEPGKRDIRVGGRLARRLGAAVTLLHVTRGSETASPLARAHLERAVTTLRQLDVNCEVRLRSAGTPAAGILAEGHAGDYDLIVVGRHGPPSRSFFGLDDMTVGVLARANRPVLVVPSLEV